MRTIYIMIDKDNRIQGWSSNKSPDTIQIEIDEEHIFFKNPPKMFKYIDGEIVEDHLYMLNKVKKRKNTELNQACHDAIVEGFWHTVNGEPYFFSYDINAQVNFGDAKAVMNQGLVDQVNWTVRDQNGNYTRIPITKADMDAITLTVMQHKEGKLAHYRDNLYPLLDTVTNIDQVADIQWDMKKQKTFNYVTNQKVPYPSKEFTYPVKPEMGRPVSQVVGIKQTVVNNLRKTKKFKEIIHFDKVVQTSILSQLYRELEINTGINQNQISLKPEEAALTITVNRRFTNVSRINTIISGADSSSNSNPTAEGESA